MNGAARFPLVAAHTGCGTAPDNTWDSLLEGIRSGADIVEVDVRVCKGGTAILLHDDSPYLDRCTYEELNRPEIRAKLSGHDPAYDVVKLEDALALLAEKRLPVNLDLKSAASVDPAMSLVRRFRAQRLVFTTGFSEGLTERHPDIQAMWNTPTLLPQGADEHSLAERVCEHAVRHGYRGLNMHHATCRETVVRLARSMNLLVWAYTVNEAEEMKRLIALGIDAITTRKPTVLQEIKAGLQENGN